MIPSMTAEKALRRSLGTTLLVFHGLGVIIGAGIYVLVGSVIATAGSAAPSSFLLAGVVALWRLHQVSRSHDGFHVPRIIPPATAASTLPLMPGVLIRQSGS